MTKYKHVCKICNKEFETTKPYSKYCGVVCSYKSRFGNKYRQGKTPTNAFQKGHNLGKRLKPYAKFTCKQCGREFEVPNWIVNQQGREFCNSACRYEWNKGENHWHYLGGYDGYRGRSWKAQRAFAVKRDKGTCQDCGKIIGDSIPVHHIVPFRNFDSADEANKLDNLICVCQSCHMKREGFGVPLR